MSRASDDGMVHRVLVVRVAGGGKTASACRAGFAAGHRDGSERHPAAAAARGRRIVPNGRDR